MQDASRRSWGNFSRIAKFSLCIVISLHSEFLLYREISLHSEIFAMLAKFRYIAKFSPVAKLSALCFCVQTTPSKPRGPLTTRQPVEYKWRSGYPTPL